MKCFTDAANSENINSLDIVLGIVADTKLNSGHSWKKYIKPLPKSKHQYKTVGTLQYKGKAGRGRAAPEEGKREKNAVP